MQLTRAQLEKDRANLAYSVIRSPVSGVVVARNIDVGQTVAASFQTPTLFQIAQDLSKMQIDSSFAEADIGNIRVGQVVRFNVDAFPNRAFKGEVKQVRLNPTTQQNVVTYDVVVSVDNPDQILLPGMTAYVNIVVAERNDALLVPNAALRYKPADARSRPLKTTGGGKRKRDAYSGTRVCAARRQTRLPSPSRSASPTTAIPRSRVANSNPATSSSLGDDTGRREFIRRRQHGAHADVLMSNAVIRIEALHKSYQTTPGCSRC